MGFLSALNLGGTKYDLKAANIFDGTREQWNALTQEQQDKYDYAIFEGDEEEQDLTNAYLTTDNAVSTIAQGDYIPILKTDSSKKKVLWSTIIAKIKSALGTAAQKDSTDEVTENSSDLVESGAVHSEVNSVKQALTTKADKSGTTFTGNISVQKTATGYTNASVTVIQNNSDTGENVANLVANQEGGNLRLAKGNNTAHLELDTSSMNGSTGFARLYTGDSNTEAKKTFKFNEDGGFTDGNGVNTTTLNSVKGDKKFMPIFGTTSGRGPITNVLNVDLTAAEGNANRVGYVYSGYTASLPADCDSGIREVFYYNSTNVYIKITGKDTSGNYCEWGNLYNGSDWGGWQRLNFGSNIAYSNGKISKATKAYVRGEPFLLNGILMKAKTDIASGANLVLDSNYFQDEKIAIQLSNYPKIYTASGHLWNAGTGTSVGQGIATVLLFASGFCLITFDLKITVAGSNSSDYEVGINRDILTQTNSNIPLITPVNGGYCIRYAPPVDDYYSKFSSIYNGYGTQMTATSNKWWAPARNHNGSNVGGFSDGTYAVNTRLTGICFGKIS